MRSLSPANVAALNNGELLPRDFLWITARDREDGSPVSVGFWSGVKDVNASVYDPNTGNPDTRAWYGSGTLINIDAIPLLANGTVSSVNVTMSHLNDRVNTAIRFYDCKQAPIEIYRGLLSKISRQLVDSAFCRFVGFVDEINIETPREAKRGEKPNIGKAVLTIKPHSQEFTRANPATRTTENQKLINPTDTFFNHANTVSEWDIKWGEKDGRQGTRK